MAASLGRRWPVQIDPVLSEEFAVQAGLAPACAAPPLAERLKSSAMLITKAHWRAALAAVVLASASAGAGAATKFRSAEEALEQGMSAYSGGYYEIAIPALEFAASKDLFLGQFYLARVYADNAGPHTDHAKAYMLYQRIADEHADIDPDDDKRAAYVAKSLTALAAYVRNGIREIGLKPDQERAAEYLHHAATFFNDEDAQFELAKLLLRGDGVNEDVARAKHWLSVLTQKGHAGAQAFLADLYWRGKHLPKDENKAFALITVAVENAPASERIWIEDIYQNIFCGASTGIRKQAEGVVAVWRKQYGRSIETRDRSALGGLVPQAERTCSNGEQVVPMHRAKDASVTAGAEKPAAASPAATAPAAGGAAASLPRDPQPFARGSASVGLGLMDAGASAPAARR